jgi:hypothetical protein
MSRRKVIYEVHRMEVLRLIEVQRNLNTSNVFVLLDTSAQHAPKQDLIKKTPRRSSNKKVDAPKNYRPDSLRGIILG